MHLTSWRSKIKEEDAKEDLGRWHIALLTCCGRFDIKCPICRLSREGRRYKRTSWCFATSGAHQPTTFSRQVLVHLIFHLQQLSSNLQQIRRRVHGGCFLNFCGEPAGLSSGRCVAAASTFGSMARLWGEGWGDWGELGGHRGEAILP